MNWINNALIFIWESLMQEFIVVVFGVLFAQFFLRCIEKRQYGGWKIWIKKGDEVLIEREISPGKAKNILIEPADMAVFVKGVASPYAWINCDLLTEGKKNGLFVENRDERYIIVDLKNNPPKKY